LTCRCSNGENSSERSKKAQKLKLNDSLQRPFLSHIQRNLDKSLFDTFFSPIQHSNDNKNFSSYREKKIVLLYLDAAALHLTNGGGVGNGGGVVGVIEGERERENP